RSSALTGPIPSAADQDIFAIFINDPASFSASTNNSGTDLTVDDDTLLFLLNASGLGVLGNDDADATSAKSTIPAGAFTGASGVYFIAVSIFANTPISSGEEIFDLAALGGPGPPAVR